MNLRVGPTRSYVVLKSYIIICSRVSIESDPDRVQTELYGAQIVLGSTI